MLHYSSKRGLILFYSFTTQSNYTYIHYVVIYLFITWFIYIATIQYSLIPIDPYWENFAISCKIKHFTVLIANIKPREMFPLYSRVLPPYHH